MVTARASGSEPFDGSLAVDLRTLATGIALRDEHLRENYLEVGKGRGFERRRCRRCSERVTADMPEGKGWFSGVLALHGVSKAVTGQVEVRRADAGLRVKASFPVELADYGIPKPRYLGIGVRDTVQVEVVFALGRSARS